MTGEVRVTLGGNATVLVEGAGARVITDPWLSDRIGPWPRLRSSALAYDALAHSTLVLISHAHPDHLDPATLSQLPPQTPVLSPHGHPLNRLRRLGFSSLHPLAAWEGWESPPIRVTAVPAYHTRWSLGYVLELGGKRIYFPGDPNPRTPFAEIARRCGPLDVSLIPVGGSSLAFGPLQRHLTPAMAARAAAELAARVAIPIHWGHVRCVPGFLDRFRGTAKDFAMACRQIAPSVEVILPDDGEAVQL